MTMLRIDRVSDLMQIARQRRAPARIACAGPEDPESLQALRMAADAGIVQPLAVGNRTAIQACAAGLGIALDGFEFEDVTGAEQVARRATEIVNSGQADLLMKGRVPTKTIMVAALNHRSGLRSGRIFSHVSLFDAPLLKRPVAMTDPAVNIKPNLTQKIEIIRNAVEVMRRLGLERPRVAMLAAIENVQLPAMPATLDARLIERMAESGELGDIIVQGPLALDDAVSPEVVRAKNIGGTVAGNADILVAPEIETANVLYKAITCFAGLEGASIVVGGTAPIVVPGRADTIRMKLLSIALGVIMLEG